MAVKMDKVEEIQIKLYSKPWLKSIPRVLVGYLIRKCSNKEQFGKNLTMF